MYWSYSEQQICYLGIGSVGILATGRLRWFRIKFVYDWENMSDDNQTPVSKYRPHGYNFWISLVVVHIANATMDGILALIIQPWIGPLCMAAEEMLLRLELFFWNAKMLNPNDGSRHHPTGWKMTFKMAQSLGVYMDELQHFCGKIMGENSWDFAWFEIRIFVGWFNAAETLELNSKGFIYAEPHTTTLSWP